MKNIKYCLTLALTSLIVATNADAQPNQGAYNVFTIKEQFKSNGSVTTRHFISNEAVITNLDQFRELYFDKTIDYITQHECQKGDTLNSMAFLVVWGMSVIDDFEHLEKIVNDSSSIVGTRSTDKSTFIVYATAVSGEFCQCLIRSDNGEFRSLYLPVRNFAFENGKPDIVIKDLDLLGTKVLGR